MGTAPSKFFIDNTTVVGIFKEAPVGTGKAVRIMAQFVGDCIMDDLNRNAFFGKK